MKTKVDDISASSGGFDRKLLSQVSERWSNLWAASRWCPGEDSGSLDGALWIARDAMRGTRKGENRVEIVFRENGYVSECLIGLMPSRRLIGRGTGEGQTGQLDALHAAVCVAIKYLSLPGK